MRLLPCHGDLGSCGFSSLSHLRPRLFSLDSSTHFSRVSESVRLLWSRQVLPLDKVAKRPSEEVQLEREESDPLANPVLSMRFTARLLAKARLAVFVEV
ncbi:hypothetical protein GW17_00022952 [Ensete ventricosum]|nr:hypothetical protein GW17_00022952 [Ensete ventricosum]